MFLTRGEIHQEPLWKLWFQHLAGMVPVSALRVSFYIYALELAQGKLAHERLSSKYADA